MKYLEFFNVRFALSICAALLFAAATSPTGAATNADYTATPPFVGTSIPPNVLIVLDNSGSMCWEAYSGSYNPNQFDNNQYYGYFDGSKNYKYTNNGRWEETAEPMTNGTVANPIANGSFLNWATMRRLEVAKEVLIGGKANPRSPTAGNTVKLNAETACGNSFNKDYNTTGQNLIYPFVGNYRFSRSSDDLSVSPVDGSSSTFTTYPTSDISMPSGWSEYPTGGGVTAWDKVDESSSDGDSTYIENNNTTNPVILGFNYTDSEPSGTISVKVKVRAKKTDNGGSRKIQGVLRIDGVNHESDSQSIDTSYSLKEFSWENNPVTGAAWTWDEIKKVAGSGNLQGFGVKAESNYTSKYPRVTQVYLEISVTTPSGGPYNIIVDQGMVNAEGIIDRLGNEARFGLAYYNNGRNSSEGCSGGGCEDGGYVEEDIGFSAATDMITSIHNLTASTWTPLAETLYEMVRYFRQDSPPYYSNSPADYQTGLNYDPYYFNYSDPGQTDQYVPCAKSFILFLTDGESTQDTNIPGSIQGYSSGYRFAGTTVGTTYDNNGRDYMIDVAFWARTNDMRSGSCTTTPTSFQQCLPEDQRIVTYPVFMFGAGSTLLKDVGIDGGFEDMNGNNRPDCNTEPRECYRDSNGDGQVTSADNPITYFEGDDGSELETNITNAIASILKRSASGTSVSILATSQEGEGALYQAYFYPEKIMDDGSKREWLGYCRGLFLDSYGNLREDTNTDARLVFQDDKILRMRLDESTNDVKADLYNDSDEDGDADPQGSTDTVVSTVGIDNITSIWEGGKKIALRTKTNRNIYTWVDADNDGVVDESTFDDTGEARLFTSTNASTLRPYLRASDSTEATNIINFIRGSAISGYRNRCLPITGASQESGCSGATDRAWALGDIVYSTPTVVATPKEQYDLIYGDSTYTLFRNTYKDRRNVVFVGANDGMLHAFNAGVYTVGDDPSTTTKREHGWFIANPTTGDGWGAGLGDELWAFVPYDNLPHLKWLTSTGYSHVYYVDLKPKVTDVRIFNDSATGVSGLIDGQNGASHPNGWGSILIMGMRLGGGAINVDLNGDGDTSDAGEQSFRSAYYAFDITDPERPPKLLWRFTDANLGFTTSYPAVVHFGAPTDNPASQRWYMIVGSGPDNNAPTGTRGYDGSSTQRARIYVVNLLNGTNVFTFTNLGSDNDGTPLDNNAFMGDPVGVDGDLDYKTDVIYIGSVKDKGKGRVYRITTGEDSDPEDWTLSILFKPDQPTLATPTVSRDSLNNFWVFFGTGRLWDSTDKTNSDQQTFYGIKDACWNGTCTTTYQLSDLLNTTAVQVSSSTGSASQVSGSATACGGSATCSYIQLLTTVRSSSIKGWYVDLSNPTTPSERVLSPASVLGGIVLFTSSIPNSDICAMLGDSYLYALYYETGTAYIKPVIGTETISGTEYIKKSTALGKGMPTTVGIAVGKETKGFVQTSTGTIIEVEAETPGGRSGQAGWRERTGGGGTSGIEMIYKHIVK